MQNLSIAWDPVKARGDWQLGPKGLVTGQALTTAVYVSLFTDRKAGPDDKITDGSDDRRGWWGDSFADRPIGSRLWLLQRAKRTPETLRKARDMIREALQWLVDDGLVARFDVTTAWATATMLSATVTLWQRDGKKVALAYQWAWVSQEA